MYYVRAFGMNPKVGGSSSPQVETFFVSKTSTLSQEHPFVCRKWFFFPRTVSISNINFQIQMKKILKNLYCFPYRIEAYNKQVRFKIQYMHIEKTGWVSLSTILLTQWGRVKHICVGKLTIIGSDNGLTPGCYQAINWTNAGKLSIGAPGTNFSEISIGIQTFPFKKMHLKMSFAKWRPFCHCLHVLTSKTFVKCTTHQ